MLWRLTKGSSLPRLPELSNFGCLPGRAGGSPSTLGAEFRDYTILGACNPALAHQALEVELEIGLLLPCNVAVYQADDGCVVSIVDPISMLGVAQNPELETIALEAQLRLQRVIESLAA